MHRTITGTLALSFLISAAAARADDGEGAFRLGAGTDVGSWSSTNAALAGTASHVEGFDVGVLSPALSLDLGYQLIEWIVVGVIGGLRYDDRHQSVVSGTFHSSTVAYEALAYVEGSFRADVARPFARVMGGAAGSDEHGLLSATSTSTGFGTVEGVVGGALGVHVFATSGLSISPILSLTYAAGSGNFDPVTASSSHVEQITITLGVELLGWIGGARERHAPTSEPDPATWEP